MGTERAWPADWKQTVVDLALMEGRPCRAVRRYLGIGAGQVIGLPPPSP